VFEKPRSRSPCSTTSAFILVSGGRSAESPTRERCATSTALAFAHDTRERCTGPAWVTTEDAAPGSGLSTARGSPQKVSAELDGLRLKCFDRPPLERHSDRGRAQKDVARQSGRTMAAISCFP
jgi:hypothetical protein